MADTEYTKDFLNMEAEKLFPVQWSKANTGAKQAKKRHNLRRRVRGELQRQALIDKGYNCGNCNHYLIGHQYYPGRCDLHSGGEWHALTKAKNICIDHEVRANG